MRICANFALIKFEWTFGIDRETRPSIFPPHATGNPTSTHRIYATRQHKRSSRERHDDHVDRPGR